MATQLDFQAGESARRLAHELGVLGAAHERIEALSSGKQELSEKLDEAKRRIETLQGELDAARAGAGVGIGGAGSDGADGLEARVLELTAHNASLKASRDTSVKSYTTLMKK